MAKLDLLTSYLVRFTFEFFSGRMKQNVKSMKCKTNSLFLGHASIALLSVILLNEAVQGFPTTEIFPEMDNFSVSDHPVVLCRHNETIRVPVYSVDNIATIPCLTDTSPEFDNLITLYQKSPDTGKWQLIYGKNATTEGKVLEYVHDAGFRYNASGDTSPDGSTYLGKYSCNMTGSDSGSYIAVELYKDDYFVNVYGSDELCQLQFYVNSSTNSSFFCKVRKDLFDENSFKWFFQGHDDGIDSPVPKNYGKRTLHKDMEEHFIVQELRLNFPRANITGLTCRVQKKESGQWVNGSIAVLVKDQTLPIIFDSDIPEEHEFVNDGINLTCTYRADPLEVQFWENNGKKRIGDSNRNEDNSYNMSLSNVTLEPGVNTVNYSCVVGNNAGQASRLHVIHRRKADIGVGVIWTVVIIVGCILCVLSLMMFLVHLQKKRRDMIRAEKERIRAMEAERKEKLEMKQLDLDKANADREKMEIEREIELERTRKEHTDKIEYLRKDDPVDSSKVKINYDTHERISDKHGEVYKATIVQTLLDGTTEEMQAILKTLKWPINWNPTQAGLVFNDLIQEIKIVQRLHQGGSHPNIVRYLGYDAPYVEKFKIFLILDLCEPGSLEEFLEQHAIRETYYDDIYEGRYCHHDRMREQRTQQALLLGTSHLMKWAEKMACAMVLIAGENIVHRDLATRNVLLNTEGQSNTIDDLVVKISDFGMARFVADSNSAYIFQNASSNVEEQKPRDLPARWYAPEALGQNPEYTIKSDVWSFGCLLWEMFNLSTKNPYEDNNKELGSVEVFQRNLKAMLTRGIRLQREDSLLPIPDEIWEIMQDCWEFEPERRPDFVEIHKRLVSINNEKYKLYDIQDEEASEESQNEGAEEIDQENNLPTSNTSYVFHGYG